MIILYICSKRFEKYLKISTESVLKYNPNAEIIIITKDKLDVPFEQINLDTPKKIKNVSDEDNWICSSKIYCVNLPYDKIILLGADTICQGSLETLWNKPCEYINACKSHYYGETQARELEIENYINVDMMVMNLKRLREDDFINKVFATQDYPVNMWCNEETLINGSYHNKIKILPQKYNYAYNRIYRKPMANCKAVILHFIGNQKEDMVNYYKARCQRKGEMLNVKERKE